MPLSPAFTRSPRTADRTDLSESHTDNGYILLARYTRYRYIITP